MGGYTVPIGGGDGAIDPELVKGCTVLGEVIAVYGGWGTEFEPVYGITGGIVRAATGWGTGRNAAEENTVPGEGVAGYGGWVIGSVYVATGAERAKGGTVRGATEVCRATGREYGTRRGHRGVGHRSRVWCYRSGAFNW